jgi:hypothetical protein
MPNLKNKKGDNKLPPLILKEIQIKLLPKPDFL